MLFDRVTEDLARRIAVAAETRGVGVSDVIRDVLELYSRGRGFGPETPTLKQTYR